MQEHRTLPAPAPICERSQPAMPTKPEFPTLLDSTMLSCFDSCERKFFYEFICHLAPLAISPHLHAGGAFARGIEIVRRSYYEQHRPLPAALADGARALITFHGDFNPKLAPIKSCENMLAALYSYFETYPPATDPYQPLIFPSGKPAVEFTFAIPTEVSHPETGEPLLYAGRADMIALYNDSLMCLVDEKTTGSISTKWADKWAMRGQFMGYCYAAQQSGYPISHCLIRGIGILKTKFSHIETLEHYPNFQLDAWWRTLNIKLERMVAAWESGLADDINALARSYIQSYGDGCSSYAGCMFLDLCTSPDPTQRFSSYQERHWNPIEKDPSWPADGPQSKPIANISELGL